ncbi:MAG: hypothetical protein ACI959_001477 [Limisphaerales bacterium]|jgi:hypothetical protein
MKRLIYILLTGLSLSMGMSSCEDFLNLEPETGLSTAIAIDNLTGADAVINGAYTHLHSDWAERQLIFSETLANNVVILNPINNTNYNATLNHASSLDLADKGNYLFELSYTALNLVNNVLVSLEDISTITPEDEIWKRQLEGEAYFLRGLIYHVLNRFFAQPQNGLSVMIYTAPTFVSECSGNGGPVVPRASIEEVKAQILADLQAADERMFDLEGNSGRASKWATKALLARVNFDFRNYTEAENYASQVIDGPFTLIDGNPLAAFQDLISTEHIFTFLSSAQDPAAANLYTRFAEPAVNVMLGVAPDLYTLLNSETGDLRASEMYGDFDGDIVTKKYDTRLMHIPYIRLPEMFLTRAEARAENGNTTGALDDLNEIRDRAGLDAATFSDAADLKMKIYNERKRELALEGDDFHNRKRLQWDIGGYPWTEAEYKLVFFMPTSEVDVLCITQNPSW